MKWILTGLLLLVCGAPVFGQADGRLIFPGETDPLVLQWGSAVVEDFLALHQLPSSESQSIAVYGRQDLRDNLRAFAWSKLQLLLEDSRTTLDPVEERMISRLAEVVKAISIESVKIARDEKNRFLADRYKWKPDAELSAATGYTYDGSYWAPRLPYQLMVENQLPPLSPTKDFFIAYGQKKSWLETISGRSGGLRSLSHISIGGAIFLSVGFTAAIALGIVMPKILAGMTAFKTLQQVGQAADGLGKVARVTRWGPANWIGIGITIAIIALIITVVVVLYTENERIENEYSALDSQYTELNSKRPLTRAEIAEALANSTANGMAAYWAFLRMVVPLIPPAAPAALPVPDSSDPVFTVRVPGSGTGTVASSITFPGWDGERTRARLWRGWFLQDSLVPMPNLDANSLNTRIRFLWNGKKYEAMRIGRSFAVERAQSEATDSASCSVDRTTGITAGDLTKCRSFITRDLEMDLETVGRRVITITQPLSFTSSSTAKVAAGQAFGIPVTTAGLPEPTISVIGSLPSGFTLGAGALPGTATLNWSGSGAVGVQSVSLRADNGVESKTMTLQVTVSQSVQFTSPPSTNPIAGAPYYAVSDFTFEAGKYVSIPVTATGFPTPTIEFSGLNQYGDTCGLTAKPYSGEYLVSGYVQPPAHEEYCYFGFRQNGAANPLQPPQLALRIFVTPPAAQPSLLTGVIRTPAGLPRQYTISTFGTDAKVAISLTTDASGQQMAPSWVFLRDEGNGSATLSVTPPADAPENVRIPIWYRVAGTDGNKATSATDGITLIVERKPLFIWTRGDIGRFDVGSSVDQYFGGQAQNQDANVSFRVDPALPPGLQIRPGNYGAFEIYGRATVEGDYNLTMTATNSYGSATEPLRLVVSKAAKIDSPSTVNFYIGRSNRFEITAKGFPRGPLGTDLKYLPPPMSFWVSNNQYLLGKNGLRWETSDSTTGEPYYGRVFLSGTPTSMAALPLTVAAQTAGLTPDSQNLTILFTTYGDVNGDFVVNCNDVSFITSRMGQRKGFPQYNYNADINQDGVIDVRDVAVVSSRLPAGTRCQ